MAPRESVFMNGQDHKLRVLLIGPLPPPIGGATKLFGYLVEGLEAEPGCELEVINISRPQGRNRLLWNAFKAIEVLWLTFSRGRRAHVISFHANERGRLYFGPVVYLVSRLLGKPLVVRAFGGTFHHTFRSSACLLRHIVQKTYLRADVCMFETRVLVRYFSLACGSNTVWFPNCTRLTIGGEAMPGRETAEGRCRQLVFLGRVVPEKGIELLYEIAAKLPDDVMISIFGPLGREYTRESLAVRGLGKVQYRGILDDEGVEQCLKSHHALILPTYHRGEGYPGVILESYAQGRPVIVSRLKSIEEIVDEGSGILVPPRDADALLKAIRELTSNDALYRRLCAGAAQRAAEFDCSERTRQFLSTCSALVNDKS